jgi:hypothetical protein
MTTMTTTAGDTHGTARSMLAWAAGSLLALLLLPACLLLGVPVAAWAIAFGLVVANRALQALVAWSVRDSSLTVQLGSLGFSTIFRALLVALTLFFVGASVGAGGDRPVGLDRPDLAKGALVIFVLCFTLDAGIETIRRAGERERLAALPVDDTTPRETHA